MSVPMNPYNGGQNIFNFLPGGYYNPTGTGSVPGISNNPQLQGFVNQMMNLFREGGGISDSEAQWRDNWLRQNGYANLFPQQATGGMGNAPVPTAPSVPTFIPYDPTNAGQNPTNFQPGGYYNRQGAVEPVVSSNPPSVTVGQPYTPPYMQPKPPAPTTTFAGLTGGNNMGPNFGGAIPGGNGVGTYSPMPMGPPRFGMGGGSYSMRRRPTLPTPITNWNLGPWAGGSVTPLTGLAQRLLPQVNRPVAPRQPINLFRANQPWG